jgi:hypothetical protein
MSDNNAARQGDEIIHSSIFADITSIVAEGAAYAVIGAAVGAAATVAAPLLGQEPLLQALRRLDPAVC